MDYERLRSELVDPKLSKRERRARVLALDATSDTDLLPLLVEIACRPELGAVCEAVGIITRSSSTGRSAALVFAWHNSNHWGCADAVDALTRSAEKPRRPDPLAKYREGDRLDQQFRSYEPAHYVGTLLGRPPDPDEWRAVGVLRSKQLAVDSESFPLAAQLHEVGIEVTPGNLRLAALRSSAEVEVTVPDLLGAELVAVAREVSKHWLSLASLACQAGVDITSALLDRLHSEQFAGREIGRAHV